MVKLKVVIIEFKFSSRSRVYTTIVLVEKNKKKPSPQEPDVYAQLYISSDESDELKWEQSFGKIVFVPLLLLSK